MPREAPNHSFWWSGSNLTGCLPLNSTVYKVRITLPCPTAHVQIMLYEMGSFDPSLSAMANMQFLGMHLVGSAPGNTSMCVTGFDQASFMIGTISSLFNICPPPPLSHN